MVIPKSADTPIKKLPAGVVVPNVSYLELDDNAFQDKNIVQANTAAYEYMSSALTTEFKEMRELVDILVGRHYTTEELAYLKSIGQDAIRINLSLTQMVAVKGTYINTQTMVNLLPRENEDALKTEVQQNVLDWALTESGYYEQLIKRLDDTMGWRRGWMGYSWVYSGRYPDGHLVTRAENPFDHLFDTDSTDRDINKGLKHIKARYYDADTIIMWYVNDNPALAEYLDKKAIQNEGPKARERRKRNSALYVRESPGDFTKDKKGGYGEISQYSESGMPTTTYFDSQRGLYKVIEYHQRKIVKKKYLHDPITGDIYPLDDKLLKNRSAMAAILQELHLGENAIIERYVPEYWVTTTAPGLADDVVLQNMPYTVQNQQDDLGFAYKASVCYDQAPDKGKHLSLLDAIKDIQRQVNLRESIKTDIVKRLAHPEIWLHESSIGQYKNDWMSRSPGVRRRFTGDVQKYGVPKVVVPEAGAASLVLEQESFFMSAMEEITGVNKSIRGIQQSSGQSGRAGEYLAQRAGIMIEPILHNQRTAIIQDVRFIHAMLCTHMTEPRILRIIGPDKQQRFMRINAQDPSMQDASAFMMKEAYGKYDFVISEKSMTPVERQQRSLEWNNWLGTIADPVLRVMVSVVILELAEDPQKYAIIEILKKWLLMTQGESALMSLDELRQKMQMQQQMQQQQQQAIDPNQIAQAAGVAAELPPGQQQQPMPEQTPAGLLSATRPTFGGRTIPIAGEQVF